MQELGWHGVTLVLFFSLPLIAFALYARFTDIPTALIFSNLQISILRMTIAYTVSAFLGWLCAVLFYKGNVARIALPFFDVLQSIPTYAALPLAVALLGPSDLVVVLFLVLAIIWPIFFSVVSTLKLLKPEWEEAVEMSDLRGFEYVKKFLWPASTPGLITGSIIGLGDGWEALIATEIIVKSPQGLGTFFNTYSQNSVVTTFGIVCFLVLIFSINKLVWLPLLERSHRMHEE